MLTDKMLLLASTRFYWSAFFYHLRSLLSWPHQLLSCFWAAAGNAPPHLAWVPPLFISQPSQTPKASSRQGSINGGSHPNHLQSYKPVCKWRTRSSTGLMVPWITFCLLHPTARRPQQIQVIRCPILLFLGLTSACFDFNEVSPPANHLASAGLMITKVIDANLAFLVQTRVRVGDHGPLFSSCNKAQTC